MNTKVSTNEYISDFISNIEIIKYNYENHPLLKNFHLCPCRQKVFYKYFDIMTLTYIEIIKQMNLQQIDVPKLKDEFRQSFYIWLINNGVSYKFVGFVCALFSPLHEYFLTQILSQIDKYIKYDFLSLENVLIRLQNILETVIKINLFNLVNFNIECKNLNDSFVNKIFNKYQKSITKKYICVYDEQYKNNDLCENCIFNKNLNETCEYKGIYDYDFIHFILHPEYLYIASKMIKVLHFIKRYHIEGNQIPIILDFKLLNVDNFRCNKEFYKFVTYLTKHFENISIQNIDNDLWSMIQNTYINSGIVNIPIRGLINENSISTTA